MTAIAVALVPLYVAGMAIGAGLQASTPGSAPLVGEDLLLLVGFGGFAVVGAVLLARRSENPVSWIVALVPLVLGIAVPAEAWAGYVMTVKGHPDALAIVGAWLNSWYWYALITVIFAYLPLLFPDGRLPSRRWRPVAAVPLVGMVAVLILAAVADQLHGQDVTYVIDNPIGIAGIPSLEEHPAFGALTAPLAFGFIAGVAAVVVRFRRADGIERQQLKWFIAAVGLYPTVPLVEAIAPEVSQVVFVVALLGLPTAIAVAVLRYRLYEIDRIVSRTVTYGLVTAVLVGVYALLAVVPAAVFDLESDLLVAGATLVAAAAFRPVRRWVQARVDHRFNRARYDAARIVDRFAETLREEVDLEELTTDLGGVVASTMQPTHLSMWLREAKS